MIPRSIARAAMRAARATQTTPLPAVHRGALVDGQWVTESEYRQPDGTTRVERSVTPARAHRRLTCFVCGAEAVQDQRTTYCLACGETSGLVMAGPAARARHSAR